MFFHKWYVQAIFSRNGVCLSCIHIAAFPANVRLVPNNHFLWLFYRYTEWTNDNGKGTIFVFQCLWDSKHLLASIRQKNVLLTVALWKCLQCALVTKWYCSHRTVPLCKFKEIGNSVASITRCLVLLAANNSVLYRFARQIFCIPFQAPDLGSVYIRSHIAS